jgi:hypothetical protein
VWRVVDELKAGGESPERAIRFLKDVAADAGLGPRRGVVACIRPWCVERYFVDDKASP